MSRPLNGAGDSSVDQSTPTTGAKKLVGERGFRDNLRIQRPNEYLYEKIPSGDGRFNAWTVNGKRYPHDRQFLLERGKRHRLVFRNRSDDSYPVHLHRHSFELVDVNGKPTSGVVKDTVIVPIYGRVSVDVVADQPGPSLFHCHIQHQMDCGLKALSATPELVAVGDLPA